MEALALRLLTWSDILLYNKGTDSSDGYYSSLPVTDHATGWHLATPHGYILMDNLPFKHKLAGFCFWAAYRLNVLND